MRGENAGPFEEADEALNFIRWTAIGLVKAATMVGCRPLFRAPRGRRATGTDGQNSPSQRHLGRHCVLRFLRRVHFHCAAATEPGREENEE